MKESLETELKQKTRTILKLEVEISNLKFKMIKPRPKLTIRKVLNQEYKPVEGSFEDATASTKADPCSHIQHL